MQLSKFDLGHLNLIQATYICQSLAQMGHQLPKLNDIPGFEIKVYWTRNAWSLEKDVSIEFRASHWVTHDSSVHVQMSYDGGHFF